VQWKKYQIKIICVLAFLFIAMPSAKAIERLGYIGQTWSFPIFFGTPQSTDEATYHFDTSYFLHERWSANLSINAQLAGMQLFYLELGPDFYPVQDTRLIPFISGRLLYTMIPNGDAGWQVNLGFETHVSKSSQLENLRLRVNSGVGQLFLNTEDVMFIQLIRAGLIWSF
jgi:hypothetical protein